MKVGPIAKQRASWGWLLKQPWGHCLGYDCPGFLFSLWDLENPVPLRSVLWICHAGGLEGWNVLKLCPGLLCGVKTNLETTNVSVWNSSCFAACSTTVFFLQMLLTVVWRQRYQRCDSCSHSLFLYPSAPNKVVPWSENSWKLIYDAVTREQEMVTSQCGLYGPDSQTELHVCLWVGF